MEDIDVTNEQLVCVNGIAIAVLNPSMVMTKEQALVHAAWLVVLAEEKEGEFEKVLEAVKNT